MSPNKRRLVAEDITDESNSFKQQRSSLRVNLSCISNLTDSGNGSLRRTTLHTASIETSSRSNRCSKSRGDKSDLGTPLKNMSIVLERINNDNEILSKSCEKLKEAILNKTQQMFDEQNELSVKTCSILGAKCSEKPNKTIELDRSIGTTPKDSSENDSAKKQKKQCKLKKRRLFNANNPFESVLSHSTTKSQNCSVILAGSSKGFGVLNKSLSASGESVKCCEIERRHSAASIASEGESDFTAVPIGCSTMISEAPDTENENDSEITKNQSSKDKYTKKYTVSMEITDMRGGFVRCDDLDAETAAGNSANTIRTSLNVNTSIDALNESGKRKTRQKRSIQPVAFEDTQESVNTVRTSLQMNTSLDISNKSGRQKRCNKSRMSMSNNMTNENTDIEDGVTNTRTAKYLSLTEKLKNVFIRSTEISSKESEIDNASTKSNKSVNKIPDGPSYIEATPYPTSRSVLLRSQIKQNAIANSLATNKNSENNGSKSVKGTNLGNEREKIVDGTIILDNSSSSGSYKSQATVIINESMDDDTQQDNESMGAVSIKSKHKKKLLPLHETSQLLTFSPLEGERLLPKCPTFTKRHKKGKKQLQKKKFNTRRKSIDAEHIEGESGMHSIENDLQITDDKKRNTRKPKKIISKKIHIKKIVNEDIFKQLEENRENINDTQMEASVSNKNSNDDFQSHKRLSGSQLRQTQRIIIVTTGLSNEDKNMVKVVVNTLGHAKLESHVTKRTTHVVTTGVRTINLLHGIIRGCWLISLEWVLKSLESNAWLNPVNYEMKHFSKAVLENRTDRQLFGKAYVPELFTACGYIHVQKDTTPPCNILKDLIKAAGGFTTEKYETAKIVIGTEGLKESWVLDCITTGELQSHNQYRRH